MPIHEDVIGEAAAEADEFNEVTSSDDDLLAPSLPSKVVAFPIGTNINLVNEEGDESRLRIAGKTETEEEKDLLATLASSSMRVSIVSLLPDQLVELQTAAQGLVDQLDKRMPEIDTLVSHLLEQVRLYQMGDGGDDHPKISLAAGVTLEESDLTKGALVALHEARGLQTVWMQLRGLLSQRVTSLTSAIDAVSRNFWPLISQLQS
ncbi:unnamed protein product, partial [Protopolystoma xenopodis]